ncbi:FKBP-type peptidyl-prolyl cis-trans isomerase [Terriglobus albidus]|uniref:FKBP-type peptidyl-prolyl cis-trans isomerase n=1 Tax=Terriglobus albidus TaxID=1592106 RepID=UPI0021E0CEEE|nr:FKBP-type peptidyl-prolyl cis-trans isomerase [Terriglobus albidus]
MKIAVFSLALTTSAVLAQSGATTPKPATSPATHRPAATAARKPAGTAAKAPAAASATDPAFNPKGAPEVTGTPKTLYALTYIDTKIGDGPLAEDERFYTVHYTGWLPDGTKFDSSVDRGQPFVFPHGARRVIMGWDTGFEGMHVGGKRRILVPWQLAYGAAGRGPIPPKSPLVFDIELIAQSATPPEPPAQPAQPAPSTPPPASTSEQPK